MFKEQLTEMIKANIVSLETKSSWDDLREKIIFNLLEIDFTKLIQHYKPCESENDLYISKSELLEMMDTFTFYNLSGLKENKDEEEELEELLRW